MEEIDFIVKWFVIGQAVYLTVFSVFIARFYAKQTNRPLVHIVFMAVSFLILVFLVTLAINYRIFYDGTIRLISNLFACTAFLLADFGLIRLWRNREK